MASNEPDWTPLRGVYDTYLDKPKRILRVAALIGIAALCSGSTNEKLTDDSALEATVTQNNGGIMYLSGTNGYYDQLDQGLEPDLYRWK